MKISFFDNFQDLLFILISLSDTRTLV